MTQTTRMTPLRTWAKRGMIAAGGLVLAFSLGTVATAKDMLSMDSNEGEAWTKYYSSMADKKVALVPVAMSFDIAQKYDAELRKQAELLDYEYQMRDPNWNVESAVQITDQFIAEGADVVVVMALDTRAYNRSVMKAKKAGAYIVFVNVRPTMDGDAYVGSDHYYNGTLKADMAAKFCEGKSGQVAFIQGPSGNSATISETNGMLDQFKSYPNITLVAQQTADGDANKAGSIAATILKQHPDLCAIIDTWDGQGVGIPPSIEDAGLKGKVKLITGGGGSQNACDMVKKGAYDAFISQDVAKQADVLNATIAQLFQLQPEPGSQTYALYAHARVITAENVDTFKCWDVNE